jgi:hypothetical protein
LNVVGATVAAAIQLTRKMVVAAFLVVVVAFVVLAIML